MLCFFFFKMCCRQHIACSFTHFMIHLGTSSVVPWIIWNFVSFNIRHLHQSMPGLIRHRLECQTSWRLFWGISYATDGSLFSLVKPRSLKDLHREWHANHLLQTLGGTHSQLHTYRPTRSTSLACLSDISTMSDSTVPPQVRAQLFLTSLSWQHFINTMHVPSLGLQTTAQVTLHGSASVGMQNKKAAWAGDNVGNWLDQKLKSGYSELRELWASLVVDCMLPLGPPTLLPHPPASCSHVLPPPQLILLSRPCTASPSLGLSCRRFGCL